MTKAVIERASILGEDLDWRNLSTRDTSMALALMSPREVLLLTVNGTHSAICKESREVSASRHSCLTDSFILQLFTRQRTLLGARQVGTQLSRNVSRSLEKLH